MSNPQPTAQKIVKSALEQIGIVDPRQTVDTHLMQDGLWQLWLLLDSMNAQLGTIPYSVRYTFTLEELKSTYTIGTNGDFEIEPQPLDILNMQWFYGDQYHDIEIVKQPQAMERNAYDRATNSSMPTVAYWNRSLPCSQLIFNSLPADEYVLTMNVLMPWSAELCPCCEDDSCTSGCEEGTVSSANYTITTTCDADDDACILDITGQMEDWLNDQCGSCATEYTEAFTYDGDSYDATAVLTPRVEPRPTQLALTQATEFPAGYQSMLIWNLAKWLCPRFNLEPSGVVVEQAKATLMNIKAKNVRFPAQRIDSGLLYTPRGRGVIWR